MNRALDFRDHRRRLAHRAYLQNLQRIAGLMLHERRVEHRTKWTGRPLIANVSHHSDHRHGVFRFAHHLKLSSDGVGFGPECFGHRFADHRDILRMLIVGRSKCPAAQQRNLHRLQIIRGYQVVGGRGRRLVRRRLVPFHRDRIEIVEIAHRRAARRAGRNHAGQGTQPGEQVLVKIVGLRLVVADL